MNTKMKEGPGRSVSKIKLNFNQLDQTLTKDKRSPFKLLSSTDLSLAPTPHLRGRCPSYEEWVPLILGVGNQHLQ